MATEVQPADRLRAFQELCHLYFRGGKHPAVYGIVLKAAAHVAPDQAVIIWNSVVDTCVPTQARAALYWALPGEGGD